MTEVEPLLHLVVLSLALHVASVAIYGPGAGNEYHITPSTVSVGVLHGDGLRLVGRSSTRAAHHGPQSSGEAARGIHEAEPGVATGQQAMMGKGRLTSNPPYNAVNGRHLCSAPFESKLIFSLPLTVLS